MYGICSVYNEVTPTISLSGPTNFAPLIYQAIEICERVQDVSRHNVDYSISWNILDFCLSIYVNITEMHQIGQLASKSWPTGQLLTK